jgi:hypothetical protein
MNFQFLATPTPTLTPNHNSVWIMFYKGTSLQMPFSYKKELIDLYEKTIIAGLGCGISIAEQRRNVIEDLDEMEKYIFDTFKDGGYDMKIFQKKIGKDDYSKLCKKWALNIVCALKLKLIVVDDNNGSIYVNI